MSKLFLPAKVIFMVASAFTLWQGWVFLRPEPREYSPAEIQVIRKVCESAGDKLTDKVPANSVFGVAHFINDPNDAFTQTMRETLAANPEWKVEEKSIIQKFLSDVSTAVKNATSLDEILHAGRRVGIDFVVAGKVIDARNLDEDARAEAMILVYDVKRGNAVLKENITETGKSSSADKIEKIARKTHPVIRFLVWLLFVILLPLVTSFAVHWAMEKKSNTASFLLLSAYTALDLLAAMLFSGFRIVGAGNGLLLIAAFLVCAGYNYWMCERIAGQKR